MPNFQDLYSSLGYLFYSIAASDGTVRPAETEKLKALVKNRWMPLETSTDELGTDAGHYVDIGFDFANDDGMDPGAAFERFAEHVRAHPESYDHGLRRMVQQSAEAIANAFAGHGKKEVGRLAQLEKLFQECPIPEGLP
ncbi:MAG: hypothetical protein LKM36_12650 [Flavobacteriales bacterium]|jgi:hypothetical protein|nr:hypothetical protein [Flavobacteriales bacterium]